MTLKGDAYALALAIYPLRSDAEEAIYDAVEGLGFSDDRKADLYARLAEQLAEDTPFESAVTIISTAIFESRNA